MKVQFLGLEAAVAADMATLASLASAASTLFPRAFNFQFLARTFSRCPIEDGDSHIEF